MILKDDMKEALKKLALLGGNRTLKISSAVFAGEMKTSMQTAARRLKDLEDKGFIERKIVGDGQYIKISEGGLNILRNEYYEYKKIFEDLRAPIVFRGEVFTGLGEGKYYISLDGYRRQLIDKLGFDPFPGTLNLKIDEESILRRGELNEIDAVNIDPFRSEKRTFGGGKCYRVKINGTDGAIIVPDRTHYSKDLMEIVSPKNLRRTLSLRDGNVVEVVYDRRCDKRTEER